VSLCAGPRLIEIAHQLEEEEELSLFMPLFDSSVLRVIHGLTYVGSLELELEAGKVDSDVQPLTFWFSNTIIMV